MARESRREDAVELVLVPVADPQAAAGLPTRSPDVRLRQVFETSVAGYGFRCVRLGHDSRPDLTDRGPELPDPSPSPRAGEGRG